MEIERKFLVNEEALLSSINLKNYIGNRLEQAYLSTKDAEIRIRKIEYPTSVILGGIKHVSINSKCFMTIKSKGDLSREEVEFELLISKYRDLIENKMYIGNIISKLRYEIPLENNLIAELDIYGKELFGLVIVEVEFETEEDANSFDKPIWFGEEVTNNKKYKNKNLCYLK